MLVSFLSLPAMANSQVSWTFAGNHYQVNGTAPGYSATVTREKPLTHNQMKSLCRKGLGLPLRNKYELILIDQQLINEPFSDWPMTDLKYDLNNIKYDDVTKLTASCSAIVIDSGKATNLATTGLSYAVAYYTTKQYAKIKQLLPFLIKEPIVSIDAAALITLLLQSQDSQKAEAYFDKYVEIENIRTDNIKFWLAQWKMQLGKLEVSKTIVQQCNTSNCQQLLFEIDSAIDANAQKTAGDLSSYF